MSYMFANASVRELRMGGDISSLTNVNRMFEEVGITQEGTFYYNSIYDYSKIISVLPSTWTAVPCELIHDVLVPIQEGNTFTVKFGDGTTKKYQFADGMTFMNFIYSEYNVDGWTLHNSGLGESLKEENILTHFYGEYLWNHNEEKYVKSADLINKNIIYLIG